MNWKTRISAFWIHQDSSLPAHMTLDKSPQLSGLPVLHMRSKDICLASTQDSLEV